MNILPRPAQLIENEGQFTLTDGTAIVVDPATASLGRRLAVELAPATGFTFKFLNHPPMGETSIELKLTSRLKRLGKEGYTLHVEPGKVSLRAAELPGLFYATRSLLQLLPVQILRQARVQGVAWTAPCVEIEDRPRFAWRGAMLDVSRHFMPKEFVKKLIDLLALHKLNTFHWHLTDDQGWRIEIKKYPRLTSAGAWRKETLVGHMDYSQENLTYDGIPHGGFYTQEDVREIVAYAAQRMVTIVPEIEMPGHSQAALAAYPELGNTGRALEVLTHWGINEDIYNVNESTLTFMQDVLSEVLGLFPGTFIHVGGDEVPKIQWKESPEAQARIKALGLADEDALQSYFIRRMDAFLNSRGRRLVGWDEILEGGLAENATVMSWRGEEGGIRAATSGHDVVMAPNTYTYLDYYQSEDTGREPLAIGGYLPLSEVYAYEPIPHDLPPEAARHILGAQAQLWTEYIPTPKQAEYMFFPRLSALSEVVWSPGEGKDYADFLRRLSVHLQRLDILDVHYRRLD